MFYHFVFTDFQLQYCYCIIEIIIVKFELNYHIIFSQNDNIGIWGYYIVISITAHQCVFNRKFKSLARCWYMVTKRANLIKELKSYSEALQIELYNR